MSSSKPLCPFLRGVAPAVDSVWTLLRDFAFLGTAALPTVLFAVQAGWCQRASGIDVRGVVDVHALDKAFPFSHPDLFSSWTPEQISTFLAARSYPDGTVGLADLEHLKAAVAASVGISRPGLASNLETQFLLHLASGGDDAAHARAPVQSAVDAIFGPYAVPRAPLDMHAVLGRALWRTLLPLDASLTV